MHRIDVHERRARLASRHHLGSTGADLVMVAGDLCGLHSSDPATVFLSARARVPELTVGDVEAALYDERSVLRMLGMRQTMFVVPPDLAAIMTAACAQRLAAGERRRTIRLLETQGLAEDGAAWLDDVIARVLASLAERGEAPAVELTKDVPELSGKFAFGEGKTWAGTVGASTRVLFLLAAEGLIVRARPLGSWLSSQYRWSPIAAWIDGGLEELDVEDARCELVRRWLRTYAPGTLTDLTWWTGWGKRMTVAALAAAGAVEVELDADRRAYVLADDLEPTPPGEPWAALLPSLDSTVMGWKERDWYLGGHAAELFDRNGNAGPTVWWDGHVVGAWGQRADAAVAVGLLENVDAAGRAAIEEQRHRLEAWLDGTRVMSRFPSPLEKRLRG